MSCTASPSTATAERRPSLLLQVLRVELLVLWLLVCAAFHIPAKLLGRSRWPQRFLSGVARIASIRVRTIGEPAGPHTLIVANHVSWLDIPILAAATGCAFVSKDELAGHPVMRWLCVQNATLFVTRSERRAIGGQAAALVAALRRKQPLTLFPEGTVGDGGQLLPFNPSLFSAVAPPAPGTIIRPVAIDYGADARYFGWPRGENGKANFLKLMGRRGVAEVTVRLLPPLPAIADRKRLAREAHDAIAAALAPSGIAPAAV